MRSLVAIICGLLLSSLQGEELPVRKPEFLTDTGTLLFKGKPFFPIGLYHVEPPQYELLAQNGFNAVQGDSDTDLDKFKASLDLAEKSGIAVDVPFYAGMLVKKNFPNSLEKIRLFGNHPAILCWKIIDEPDLAERAPIVGEVPEAYTTYKNADKKHPIELTLAFDKSLKPWSKFCDIVQIDRYPVPGKPLTEVSSFCRNAMAAKEPWQNLTYVVQCGWTPDLRTQPSVPQARAMVFLALINGAKGIFWYSMKDPGWDLTKTPLWPRLKEINAEIQALSQPVMLGEEVPGAACNAPAVQFLARKFEGKLYVLLCNPGDKPATATITLPDALHPRSAVLLDSKQQVEIKGSSITLNLDPVDARTAVCDLK